MKFDNFECPTQKIQITYNWIIMAKIWRGFSAHMMTCIFSQFFFLFLHFRNFWKDIFIGNFLDWISKKMIGNFVVVFEKGWIDADKEEAKCQRKNKKFCHFWQFVKKKKNFKITPKAVIRLLTINCFSKENFIWNVIRGLGKIRTFLKSETNNLGNR